MVLRAFTVLSTQLDESCCYFLLSKITKQSIKADEYVHCVHNEALQYLNLFIIFIHRCVEKKAQINCLKPCKKISESTRKQSTSSVAIFQECNLDAMTRRTRCSLLRQDPGKEGWNTTTTASYLLCLMNILDWITGFVCTQCRVRKKWFVSFLFCRDGA